MTIALALFAATASVGLVSRLAVLQSICYMIARGAIVSMLIILLILPAVLILLEGGVGRTSLNWRLVSRYSRVSSKEKARR